MIRDVIEARNMQEAKLPPHLPIVVHTLGHQRRSDLFRRVPDVDGVVLGAQNDRAGRLHRIDRYDTASVPEIRRVPIALSWEQEGKEQRVFAVEDGRIEAKRWDA